MCSSPPCRSWDEAQAMGLSILYPRSHLAGPDLLFCFMYVCMYVYLGILILFRFLLRQDLCNSGCLSAYYVEQANGRDLPASASQIWGLKA